jgi:octaprenyl-diphosphate synthase
MLANTLLKAELAYFDKTFNDAVKSHIKLLDVIMQYVAKRKGKRLRPIFVLLCAKLCGTITEQTYRSAALIELLHTATLVHDDVVEVFFQLMLSGKTKLQFWLVIIFYPRDFYCL